MLKKDAKLEMLLQILFLIPQIKSMLLIVINNIPEQFQLMPLHLTISNVL
jgi:TRAP-type mannitol/chloroaromatic compound transport system permease small subunit